MLSSIFSVGLLVGRVYYSWSFMYVFLIWNLFLAVVPCFVAILAYYLYFHKKVKKAWLYIIIFAWLAFFPNALYIVTDFIHLRIRGNVPLWYDLILILSFAWNGVMLGFLSLRIIHITIEKIFNKLYGWIFVVLSVSLSGFGIYLGRFLRWNSWDVITQPKHLFLDIIDRFVNPLNHPRTWGFSIVFAIFFIMAYVVIINMNNTQTEDK